MVSKEATEDTLAAIRNNKNVITGEEGKKLAESIPMERREYVKWERVFRGTAITFLGGFRTFLGISEIGLGAASSSAGVGVLVVGHGVAQTGFGFSDMGEGVHDIYLGFKDVDDKEQQAVRISKKVLGKYEEPLNFTVGATTDQAVVVGQAFYRFPRIGSMTGNTNSSTKKESNSNVTTEKQKTNNTGTEKVVEDTTTVKTVGSNNKNTVTQTGNNSKEVVLYKDKNSKITVDTKKVSTENNGTTGSTDASQQVNKGTTSNNQKGTTGKTVEGKNKTTNTSSYVTGIKEDEPNTFLNGTKFKELEPKSGKVENISELLTDEGIAKLKNMTTKEIKELFEKEGLNPKNFEDISGTGNGQKFSIPNNKFMIPADFEKGKRKMVTIGSVRTNSGGTHGSAYILFGTNDGKYKIVFDDPKNYKYNITNKENANIIFVNPKR